MSQAVIDTAAPENVAQMFSAIAQGDMESMKGCFAKGATIWHNASGADSTVEEASAVLGHVSSISHGIRYEDQRIVQLENLCFVQHVLIAELQSGEVLRVPAMMRIETDSEGLISRIEEYFDSRATDCLQ